MPAGLWKEQGHPDGAQAVMSQRGCPVSLGSVLPSVLQPHRCFEGKLQEAPRALGPTVRQLTAEKPAGTGRLAVWPELWLPHSLVL